MTVTTTQEPTTTSAVTDEAADVVEPAPVELVESDLLVEDVSIDGMCGVY